ncbi:hypothetical protein BH09PAT4_BH09PAT4_03250 [soil metagenome]
MNKRFVVMSAITIIVAAPLLAWFTAKLTPISSGQPTTPDTNVQAATKEELLSALQTEHKESHVSNPNITEAKVTSIQSFKVFDKWWYLVNVTVAGGTTDTLPVVVAKFFDGPHAIRIITNPGEPFLLRNISGTLGVPYDVIDSYNKALTESAQ